MPVQSSMAIASAISPLTLSEGLGEGYAQVQNGRGGFSPLIVLMTRRGRLKPPLRKSRNTWRCLFVVLMLASLCPCIAHAQTSQPASIYDNQPVKRNRPETAATPQPTNNDFDWTRLILAMAVVIGLILVLKMVVGKMYPSVGANKGGRVIRVLTRSPISPKQQVMLLQVGKRVIVVGDSAGQLSTLTEISEPDEVATLLGQIESAETVVPTSRFSSLFSKAQTDYSEKSLESEVDVAATSDSDPEIEQAQSEISGLIERMKALTRTVRRD